MEEEKAGRAGVGGSGEEKMSGEGWGIALISWAQFRLQGSVHNSGIRDTYEESRG